MRPQVGPGKLGASLKVTMMTRLNPIRAGIGTALVFGGAHLLWAIIAAVGLGQPLLDLIFRLHFLLPALTMNIFDFLTALELVALTSALGFVGVTPWRCASTSRSRRNPDPTAALMSASEELSRPPP